MAGEAKDSLVGTRIREYDILNVIGKGGMGAVYRARHIYLDEERAIKVIHAPLAGDGSAFVDRFIREAKILTKLRHPDLVELYEFGRLDENLFFMVMELMTGESVRERMKKSGRIPPEDALRIIREAASGLHVAHQRGIVHRDISPDNLMLVKTDDETEITKVIDFGIAKPLYKETHSYTIGDMFLGKPEFSSPEQCGMHEEGEEIDHRADIYSLAVTLYYIVSGKLPFYSATPMGYLVKHASEIPKLISTHFSPGEIPKGMDEMIAKALAKNRQDRQKSMEEFAEEIERIENDLRAVAVSTPTISGELQPGFVFARRYQIEKKLGRGGMGVVYKASDKFLDVPVALKTMNHEISDDERTLNRMKREVILARKISHPNVCRIYDIGKSNGINYVSMELVEGRPLAEILQKEGALSWSQALPVIKQILDGIEAAHSAGVFHRDLKPQNILVDSKGHALIMDFGISTSADVSRLTQTGGTVGTPRYMAPEQFSSAQVDHRADIYSLGIILFEMLTGKFPYEASNPATVMYAHLHHAPIKPSQIVSGLQPGIEAVILKALEKEPENRFQTAAEFREALESSLVSVSGPSARVPESSTRSALQTTGIESSPQKPKDSTGPTTIATEAVTDPSSLKKATPFANRAFLIPAAAAAVLLIALVTWFAMRTDSPTSPVAQVTNQQQPDQKQPSPKQEIPTTQAQPSSVKPEAPKQESPEVTLPPVLTETPPSKEPPDSTEPPVSAEPSPALQSPATTEPLPADKASTNEPTATSPGGTQYTVEVMATSRKARAEERIAQLTEKGFPAFLAEEKDQKGTRYRVRVGRFNDPAKAREMMARLKAELQLSPWMATIPKTGNE